MKTSIRSIVILGVLCLFHHAGAQVQQTNHANYLRKQPVLLNMITDIVQFLTSSTHTIQDLKVLKHLASCTDISDTAMTCRINGLMVYINIEGDNGPNTSVYIPAADSITLEGLNNVFGKYVIPFKNTKEIKYKYAYKHPQTGRSASIIASKVELLNPAKVTRGIAKPDNLIVKSIYIATDMPYSK